MMENEPKTKTDLELASFFDAAKEVDVEPTAAFMMRIDEDAMALTAARQKMAVSNRKSRLGAVLYSIGGWQSVAALTACACVGIFAGYSAPDSLDYFNDTQSIAETSGDGSFSVASDIETLFQEG